MCSVSLSSVLWIWVSYTTRLNQSVELENRSFFFFEVQSSAVLRLVTVYIFYRITSPVKFISVLAIHNINPLLTDWLCNLVVCYVAKPSNSRSYVSSHISKIEETIGSTSYTAYSTKRTVTSYNVKCTLKNMQALWTSI